jgi:hypothetical protein
LKDRSRRERKIMATPIRITVLATVLLLATPISASAGSANQGPGWGAVVGAGILGGIIGGATAPAPQQQIIVVVPQAAPATPAAPTVPRTVVCSTPMPVSPYLCGAPLPAFLYWCKPLKKAFPIVRECPIAFEPKALYFWCDPLRGWYPFVGENCPVLWHQITFAPGTIQ